MEANRNSESPDSGQELPTFLDLINQLASRVSNEGEWKFRYNYMSSPTIQNAVDWAESELQKNRSMLNKLNEDCFIDFIMYGRSKIHVLLENEVTQKVLLPKLSTIETYDELIKYVEEMYVNGMIVGNEFVMKPEPLQKMKLITDIQKTFEKTAAFLGVAFPFNEAGELTITTLFGVKIIIK